MRYDRHALYEASVQSVAVDLAFFEGVYRRRRGRRPLLLREDFCGTAQLAGHWVGTGGERRAWGVDLDGEVLEWCRRWRIPPLGERAARLTLVQGDVRKARRPLVDVVLALNLSYWVFHDRRSLVGYFRGVRRSLAPGGLFIVNTFGGTEVMDRLEERSRKPGFTAPDGTRVPRFTYVWEHSAFNPIDHRMTCRIHFEISDGTRLRSAFTYDWRLWTLPEVREAMAEAGFASSDVYVEGWDDEQGRSTYVYRRRTRFANQAGWLAYVMGWA